MILLKRLINASPVRKGELRKIASVEGKEMCFAEVELKEGGRRGGGEIA
jgi:hypothetical protein